MSLVFANADSIKQAIFEELQNLLTNETNVLQAAECRMKHLEVTEGYGVYLAEIIMNQSFDLPLRQIASIMLTHYVENSWSTYPNEETENTFPRPLASEQAKKMIRNILPNGLYDPSSKIRLSVAHTISVIAGTDWPNVWVELFDIIVKCLGGNEDSIHGAMQILQEFSYDEKQIKELGPLVISEVYRIFESEQNYSIKTRTAAIRILKPLFHSISINISDKQEQSSMMNSILQNFMTKLMHYLSMNCGTVSNFNLRTNIVKILTFLVTEMPKHILPYMDVILPIIWQLLTQIADIYVKITVNQTESVSQYTSFQEDDEDEQTNFSTMIVQIFEFIQCVIGAGKFRSTIKNVLTDLIYIMIVYIQVPEELIEDWNEDPERFVEDEDEGGVELTIRLSGRDVLGVLEDELGARTLPALQEALGRHMNVAEAEKSAGNTNWWKIHEACMVAVHTFRELILEAESKFDLLNYLTLVRSLLNYQESAHLVGRALWTLSTYSKSKLYNPHMLEEILNVTLLSLSNEKPMVLKISAVRAINGFVQDHKNSDSEKRALIKAKLPGFVDGILNIIPGCKSSVLALLLESLTTIVMFDPSFTSTAHNKLIPLTIAVFLKYPEDPFILEIVQEMIKVLSQNPLCRQVLQEKFIPIIVSIISIDTDRASVGKQDIAIDVLTQIVKYSTAPLSNALLENAFPAMIQCVLRSDDHSVMVSGGECLRAFSFVSPEQICAFRNGEGLDYVLKVTELLLNPVNNELTAGQIGRLVITIITKMGDILGDSIDQLLKAVISKMQLVNCLKVTMSLVVIFAHLFLTQMDAVLNFLSMVPGPSGETAMQFVLNSWLAKQTLFFGAYERKVTTMALCRLFEYGITSQDSRITSITFKELVVVENTEQSPRIQTRSKAAASSQNVTIPALVKIFKLLINELSYLREANSAGYESVSDDDDDDDPSSSVGDVEKRSPPKSNYVSDLYFDDDEEESADDDHLMQELMKEPLFQTNMEENLTKFLQNFSSNEHFNMFLGHLNETEKNVLKSVQVKVV